MQGPSKLERNLTVAEQSDERSGVRLKSADSESGRWPSESLPPPSVGSGTNAWVKLGTALSLAALVGVTLWGALQLYRDPAPVLAARGASEKENLSPEADVARVFALCRAGDVAGARALARSFVRRHPTSPERARVERACRSGKVPD